MTLTLIPDAEMIVGAHLREHTAIAALNARVAGSVPSDTKLPWVRVTQLDGSTAPGSRPDHLIDYLIQFDCYAGGTAMTEHRGQLQASVLARTVRAVLYAAPGETIGPDDARAVVTGARITGMARMPDTTYDPARERVVLTASIHMHRP